MKNVNITRLFAVLLAWVMIFALVACQNNEGTTPDETKPATTPIDSGTTPVDSGTTPVDSGTTPVDPDNIVNGYDLSNYTVLTIPLSSATIYGEDMGQIKVIDIWGAWQIIEDGDNAGALYAEPGENMAMLYEYDYSKATKVTISAEMMLPQAVDGNPNMGFFMNTWDDTTTSPYYWMTSFNSTLFATAICQGNPGTQPSLWAGTGAELNNGHVDGGWYLMDEANAGVVHTPLEGAEFQYGQYFKLTAVWNIETLTLEMYYDDQLEYTATFTQDPFEEHETAEDGGNKCAIYSASGNAYIKNLTLVVE